MFASGSMGPLHVQRRRGRVSNGVPAFAREITFITSTASPRVMGNRLPRRTAA
jgi:hypothetical protein